jgi:hypothetical protein
VRSVVRLALELKLSVGNPLFFQLFECKMINYSARLFGPTTTLPGKWLPKCHDCGHEHDIGITGRR